MLETLKLCVSCKGCRRECPTGVDIAKMKIEVLAAKTRERGVGLRDRLVAYLPRYAPYAARAPWLLNLRNRVPVLRRLSQKLAGFAAERELPRWRSDLFRDPADAVGAASAGCRDVVFFADTFNRYFEPENARAALRVLEAGGYRVHAAKPADGATRPLCCGRTFLSVGLVDEARAEARRMLDALAPFVARGTPVVGLEPSCLLTLRDEFRSLLPGEETRALADRALLLEEFLAQEADAGRLTLRLAPVAKTALLHGHCHQKSFGALGSVERVLKLVPGLEVETVSSSCCGMAGAFGYQADTYDVSVAMGELSLLPAVRRADADTLIVADGTSCRHQIADGTGREALHVARVLAMSLDGSAG